MDYIDYKELYEATFKYAKQLYDAGSYDNETLEAIFPELKESEDERIRKGIIRCIKGNMPDNDFRKKYIAWLEAQGTKVSAIEGFETEFERQVSGLIASAINKEYEYNQGYVKWTANALLNYAKHELEKQGEHNSFSWTEDDEIKVKAMCEEGNLKPSEREWLKNLRYRVTKKKSDVFTERDRNIINNICENIQGHLKFSDVCKEDAVRYLRSLEGRMQSKKGFTDEDYKVYKSIIDDAVNKDLALTSIQKEWLKSLEERAQPHNTWKPSATDIKVLEEVFNLRVNPINYHATLHRILEQLKKL